MSEPHGTDTVVIGAGISGLACAFWLQERDIRTVLLEKANRFGGAIESHRDGDYLIEKGPNSTLETTTQLTKLIADAGVESEKCYANEASKKRFILKNGELVPLPMSPGAFLGTKLFSIGAKLGLLKEPFTKPRSDGKEETVAEFVRRRLNNEFLDYAINPFVAGVFAGDPEKLSVDAAFARLKVLEDKYGSLIKGQIQGAKERKKRAEKNKQEAKMFSFLEGMQTLTDALAAKLHDARHSVDVESIAPQDGAGFLVEGSRNGEHFAIRAKSVVVAAHTQGASELTRSVLPELQQPLADIPYPPVAEVITAFPKERISHPLDGFGFLIPEVEKREILGVIFSSTIFPRRAAEGEALLTTFVGGTRQPENARLSDEEIIDLTLREQQALLGTPAEPSFVHVTKWEHAIPQYTLGHLNRMAQVQAAEDRYPGLYFCANYRGGISVGDCVKSAEGIVERAAEQLKTWSSS